MSRWTLFMILAGVLPFVSPVVLAQQVAQSGKLTPTQENTVPVAMLKWRGKADVHFAETAKFSLSDTIHTAEQSDDNVYGRRLALSRLFRVVVPAVKGETRHLAAPAISRLNTVTAESPAIVRRCLQAYRNSASHACRSKAA
jgi:hypothetical protein